MFLYINCWSLNDKRLLSERNYEVTIRTCDIILPSDPSKIWGGDETMQRRHEVGIKYQSISMVFNFDGFVNIQIPWKSLLCWNVMQIVRSILGFLIG